MNLTGIVDVSNNALAVNVFASPAAATFRLLATHKHKEKAPEMGAFSLWSR
jgi:hypothetical protein